MLVHRGIQYIKKVVFQIDSTIGQLSGKSFLIPASCLTKTFQMVQDLIIKNKQQQRKQVSMQ